MIKQKREAGILLHLSSLAGDDLIGTLGGAAYEFVDFINAAGQTLWQINPIGPTGYGDSPYQCFSAFAGNPLFIDLSEYLKNNIITADEWTEYTEKNNYEEIDFGRLIPAKSELLKKIFARTNKTMSSTEKAAFNAFCEEYKWWLNDYAIFMALKNLFNGCAWNEWPSEIKLREQPALEKYGIQLAAEINYHKYWQFIFYKQWVELKKYANEKKVNIIGDIPIFVAYDSADVWANKQMFLLNAQGKMTAVAGVPPDYFSKTGQLWGNPLYNWEYHKSNGFDWWLKRIGLSLYLFDGIRIDHFRGFEAYWSISASKKTAINGEWIKAPGFELFNRIYDVLKNPFIIAEDLGVITPEVENLRDSFNMPGMKILQFAFSDPQNSYLPHNYTNNCVVFTGTHDNETTVGWYKNIDSKTKKKVKKYIAEINSKNCHLKLIEFAFSSTAKYAIIPMQDWLGLDNSARMNTPSSENGNWRWRVMIKQLSESLKEQILKFTLRYNRNISNINEEN